MSIAVTAPAGLAFSSVKGAQLVEHGRALSEAIRGGHWLEGGVAFLDTLGAAGAALADPIGTIASGALGWVMQYLKPLSTWLEQLTGSESNVAGVSRQWSSAGASLRTTGATLVSRLHDLDGLEGESVSAYVRFAQDTSRHLTASGEWAESAASGLMSASSLVTKMQGVVKTGISQVISTAIEAMAVVAASMGLGMGYAIARVVTKVNQVVNKVVRPITSVLRSVQSLVGLVQQLRSLFDGNSAKMTTQLGGRPDAVTVDAGAVTDASSATWLSTVGRDALIEGGRVADLADHRISPVVGLAPADTHYSAGTPTVDGSLAGHATVDGSSAPVNLGKASSGVNLGSVGPGGTSGGVGSTVTAISGGTLAAGATTAGAGNRAVVNPSRLGPVGPVSSAAGTGGTTRSGMGIRRRRLEVIIEALDEEEA